VRVRARIASENIDLPASQMKTIKQLNMQQQQMLIQSSSSLGANYGKGTQLTVPLSWKIF